MSKFQILFFIDKGCNFRCENDLNLSILPVTVTFCFYSARIKFEPAAPNLRLLVHKGDSIRFFPF